MTGDSEHKYTGLRNYLGVVIFLYPVYGVVIRIKVCESSELYTQKINVMLCKLKINKRVKKKTKTWVIPENTYGIYNENKKCLVKSSFGFIKVKTLQKWYNFPDKCKTQF